MKQIKARTYSGGRRKVRKEKEETQGEKNNETDAERQNILRERERQGRK